VAGAILCALCAGVFVEAPGQTATPAGAVHSESGERVKKIENYIARGWDSLTRTMESCAVVADPKMPRGSSVLYLPVDFSSSGVGAKELSELPERCGVRVEKLPKVISGPGQIDPGDLSGAGLLYLPEAYVVPGGRFNEMYGWDSYFIVRGLLADGRGKLAREMVENFYFEIEHYGTVLNANRVYYLTRSQPPFLSSMVLAVWETEKQDAARSGAAGAEGERREWLKRGYEYAARDYAMWTREPHLAGETGLARYYDFGERPAPESVSGEPGYYKQVAEYFLARPELAKRFVRRGGDGAQQALSQGAAAGAGAREAAFSVAGCETGSDCAGVKLTGEYFKGDRAMRESGFDVSFRFGPYGADSEYFAPVCLNSLLYKTETDLERMAEILGKADEAAEWQARAAKRKAAMERYLWDAESGMFFDYDFRNGRRSSYVFATTFYPLWAGLVTREQARAVDGNVKRFEQPGGLVTSLKESGAQWDFPYEWAPVQLLADEGLRKYGFDEDADRLSREFLSTVLENFERDGTIREKYNAVTRSSETQVSAGYHANVVGFGWTNGAFLVLEGEMRRPRKEAAGEK
jgi:alpha,alpha-trehalase